MQASYLTQNYMSSALLQSVRVHEIQGTKTNRIKPVHSFFLVFPSYCEFKVRS